MTDTTNEADLARRDKAQGIALAVWDRWNTGTRAWLEKVGSWESLAADVDEYDAKMGDAQYAALSVGGVVEVSRRPLAAVDLVGFHLVFDDEGVDVDEVVDQMVQALDAAVIGRADMIVRTAGATDPTGLVSATGGLRVKEFTPEGDDPAWHVVGRMKVAMAMAKVDPDDTLTAELAAEAEAARERAIAEAQGTSLPPAVTAEPEAPIVPADDDGAVPAATGDDDDGQETEVEEEPVAKKAPAAKKATKKAAGS